MALIHKTKKEECKKHKTKQNKNKNKNKKTKQKQKQKKKTPLNGKSFQRNKGRR